MPSMTPTLPGTQDFFPSLFFPLQGCRPELEMVSQRPSPCPSLPHTYLSQGGGRACWDLSPSASRSSRCSSQVLPGMVKMTMTPQPASVG